MRAKHKLTETDRMMLRELNFRYLTELDIADGLDLLKGLLGRPMLVMPHVSVRLADGSMLAKRRSTFTRRWRRRAARAYRYSIRRASLSATASTAPSTMPAPIFTTTRATIWPSRP